MVKINNQADSLTKVVKLENVISIVAVRGTLGEAPSHTAV